MSRELKICPLCNSLNVSASEQCFVCSWHGTFINDAEAIDGALSKMIDRCGALEKFVDSTPTPSKHKLRTFFHKLRKIIFAKLWGHKPLDFRA
jgi:hypothetical protein